MSSTTHRRAAVGSVALRDPSGRRAPACGAPSASARWSGPVSPPTKSRAAADQAREAGESRAAAAGRAPGSSAARRSARASSPGPHEITGVQAASRVQAPREAREALLAPGLLRAAGARMEDARRAAAASARNASASGLGRASRYAASGARRCDGDPDRREQREVAVDDVPRVAARARRARRRAAPRIPRGAARARSRRPGAAAMRATTADFQSPCTSIVAVRRERPQLAAQRARSRASVAGGERAPPPRLACPRRRRASTVRVALEQSRERALDDPPDRRARRRARSPRAAARG